MCSNARWRLVDRRDLMCANRAPDLCVYVDRTVSSVVSVSSISSIFPTNVRHASHGRCPFVLRISRTGVGNGPMGARNPVYRRIAAGAGPKMCRCANRAPDLCVYVDRTLSSVLSVSSWQTRFLVAKTGRLHGKPLRTYCETGFYASPQTTPKTL